MAKSVNIIYDLFGNVDVEHMRVVKEALHVSTAPSVVVCREAEQKRVLDFCKDCIEQEKAGSLYVCGCPGTGKSLAMGKVKQFVVDWTQEVRSFVCLFLQRFFLSFDYSEAAKDTIIPLAMVHIFKNVKLGL